MPLKVTRKSLQSPYSPKTILLVVRGLIYVASKCSFNAFTEIVNGESNLIHLFVENQSELNVTLLAAAGAFFDAQTDQLIKNVRFQLSPLAAVYLTE